MRAEGHTRPSLNSLGLSRNAVLAMYDLCFMDQGARLGNREGSMPDHDMYVELRGMQVRYVVCGLGTRYVDDSGNEY